MRNVSAKMKRKLTHLMKLFEENSFLPISCFVNYKIWFAAPIQKTTTGTLHSEIILCKRFPNIKNDIFVFREKYKCAKSCDHCIHYMKSKGIRKVYYTNGTDISCETLAESNYFSTFFIFLHLKNNKNSSLKIHHTRRLTTLSSLESSLYTEILISH